MSQARRNNPGHRFHREHSTRGFDPAALKGDNMRLHVSRPSNTLEPLIWFFVFITIPKASPVDNDYGETGLGHLEPIFGYTFCFNFLIAFVGVVVWNKISPWPKEWWGNYYYIVQVFIGGLLYGAISTVWFTIGGTRDLIRMFKDLSAKETNILDDGRVIDNVSADDVAMVEQIDHINIEEAHIEEEILKEELEEENREE
jgi:hypothetical protein